MNDEVKESDFGLPSQSAIVSENSILYNHFPPKTNLQHSTGSKLLPLSWIQEPGIHNLMELVNHENLNASKLGSSNFHENILINRPNDSNNHENSLISNHIPPQTDKKNLFDSNYLPRYPPNQIKNSNKGYLENFNVKDCELAEQRVRNEKVDNMNTRFQTEATLEPEKSSDNLRSNLGVYSQESLIGYNEDDHPEVVISNSNLDSNSPPLLSNVGHRLFNNLKGIELAKFSESQTSKVITNLKKKEGATNILENLGEENLKKRKASDVKVEKNTSQVHKACSNLSISEVGELEAKKTNVKSEKSIVDEDFAKEEALRELNRWENNIFKNERVIEKSQKKMDVVDKNASIKNIPQNQKLIPFSSTINQKYSTLSEAEGESDKIKGFMDLFYQNNHFLDINFLKKIIDKVKDIQEPFIKFTFLNFLRVIRQRLESTGTRKFFIPIKDISRFFQKRIYLNTKYEKQVDLSANKYNIKIITKLPKQVLQKIEYDLKDSPLYTFSKSNKGRYLDYSTRRKLVTVEIRNSFISIANIINKVIGNSWEEVINNFPENQRRAIEFFDKIFSMVDFRTQSVKDLQTQKGKTTSHQVGFLINTPNHLEFNNNLAKNYKFGLEDTIAIEEAKLLEKVSTFYADSKFNKNYKKSIISKISIQWLKIHHPQILINLNPKHKKHQESHSLIFFCRRLLNIFEGLDNLEKD
ncbi:hypothetical protein BY996DRAFT_323744 [Phakopsora pachyrhizi]|nr:hypothetical protein BY996DRAFT_323744 [Phakopsora pachyrhizi]